MTRLHFIPNSLKISQTHWDVPSCFTILRRYADDTLLHLPHIDPLQDFRMLGKLRGYYSSAVQSFFK